MISRIPQPFTAHSVRKPSAVSSVRIAGFSISALALCVASLVQAETASTEAQATLADLPIIIRSRGLDAPKTDGVATDSETLAPDRRVEVAVEEPAKATVSLARSIELDAGGSIWATEDPTLVAPVLTVSPSSMLAFENGKIAEPLQLSIYSNYPDFIRELEVLVFRGSDTDHVRPLARHTLKAALSQSVKLDLAIAENVILERGNSLQVVVRAHGDNGVYDETQPKIVQLVSEADKKSYLRQEFQSADSMWRNLSETELETQKLLDQTFGENSDLRLQNIAIYGSVVRIVGQDIADGYSLSINEQSVPIDMERKFVAEYLLPIGQHDFEVKLKRQKEEIVENLNVDVSGKHLFLVAIADVTASENRVTGSVEPLSSDDRYDDFLVEGRLGFYLKGKVQGKYLITAHADTREREIGDLFDGFFDADAKDIFRRLDPDAYYPVYGDDSTTVRDVDTQGKLYVRVNWDKNEALWGNFQTGFTGTEYGQYTRSLYGAALNWRSQATTNLGEAKTEVRGFVSEAQTSQGHSEFLGTGGSLYYLRHTDILAGSEQVVLEVRDPRTGRTVTRVNLSRDVDYDVDEMQGRIILRRPLMQISQENQPSIIRDQPLHGYENILMVDYEYHSRGIEYGDVAAGIRAKKWVNDHVAIGGTWVEEQRDKQAAYRLKGADVTLQAKRGTYIKFEHNESDSLSTQMFVSNNGGFSFESLGSNQQRSGHAQSIEGRINLQELGWTQREWTAGAWYKEVSAGFSSTRTDYGATTIEQGVEATGEITDKLKTTVRQTDAKRGKDRFEDAQAQLEWQINPDHKLTGEVRQVRETRQGDVADGTLAAVRYTVKVKPEIEVYGVVQATLAKDAGYANNDAITVGAKYQTTDKLSLGVEASDGARGDSVTVASEYKLNNKHTVYGNYTYSTDSTETDPLFGGNPEGLTLGQRYRISDQASMFNESQWLKNPSERGLAHSFGMDFYPVTNTTLGFTLQEGTLESARGTIDRQAVSLRAAKNNAQTSMNAAAEWREDTGAERREQWLFSTNVTHKLNEDWRVSGRFNWSDTEDFVDKQQGAKFVESNIGFAWRPADNTRYALLGKYTYLYDRSTYAQLESSSFYDQRSHIISLEGIYMVNQHWELAAKFAERYGEARAGRGSGDWYDSRAQFAAIQTRHRFGDTGFSALAEYRWLTVKDSGTRDGALIGVDYDLTDNLRAGVGYNFADFSDDLKRHDFEYKGWYLNIVGYY